VHLAAAAAYEEDNVAIFKIMLKHCSIGTINAQDAEVHQHRATSCKLQRRCWVHSTAPEIISRHHMMSAHSNECKSGLRLHGNAISFACNTVPAFSTNKHSMLIDHVL